METLVGSSRKVKRKIAKKLKRKQIRKEIALRERAEEEALLNDPEEQRKIKLKEQEEADLIERERKEFEERERLWIARKAEEDARRKLREEESQRNQVELKNNLNGDEYIDDDWEYVEEGPAEIIWQENEIIVKKKKVRVAKKNSDRPSIKEDDERPTSNPFPPQSAAFAAYKSTSSATAQQMLNSVAQQVPNFGTEQDKAHCPFHIKTGACRFGSRCSRVHFYPDKSSTLLIKNMYNGPGLAWEQDEGLEYTDEEVERCFEEFYEDVHTEFLKYGEIINFKVCRNGSFHLRGNVYVHYKSLESAILAYNSINGRYFAGKQITCEFVSVSRWKVAICGEYMKTRLKTCSHGTACNFIHCFRNPGGDYEWADWDKRPPKYWVKKMLALFGPSDESGYEKQMELESRERSNNSSWKRTVISDRHRARRSSSGEIDYHSIGFGDISNENKASRRSRSSRKSHSSSRREEKFLSDERRRSEEKYNSDERRYKMKRRALDHGSGGEYSDGSREQCSSHSMAFSHSREKEASSGHSSRRERSGSIKREAEFSDESREFKDEYNFYDPERYDPKHRFHDHDSELDYSDECTGQRNRYLSRKACLTGSETETDLPDEHRKSKDKYNLDNSVRCKGRYSQGHDTSGSHSEKKRSRCSDRSSRRACSNSWKSETNSLDMENQGKENHESSYEKYRVHDHEQVNEKRKSRKRETNEQSFASGKSCGDQNKKKSNSAWEKVDLQTALEDSGNPTVNSGDTPQEHRQKHRSKSSKGGRRHRKEEFGKDAEVEIPDSNANNLKSEKSGSREQLRSRSPFKDLER